MLGHSTAIGQRVFSNIDVDTHLALRALMMTNKQHTYQGIDKLAELYTRKNVNIGKEGKTVPEGKKRPQ